MAVSIKALLGQTQTRDGFGAQRSARLTCVETDVPLLAPDPEDPRVSAAALIDNPSELIFLQP